MAKNKHGRTKRRRKTLWEQNPHCCYCDCLTILPEDLPEEYFKVSSNGLQQQAKALPDNTATIEHVYSRLNPLRRKRAGILLLSCLKCNLDKSITEHSQFPKEFLSEINKIPLLSKRLKAIEEWQKQNNDKTK